MSKLDEAAIRGKKARWARAFPELGAGPVDMTPCTDPAYFELEREKIFMKTWWKVARVEELPRPGDYKVKRIDFARTSAIIVRGRDNKIRAFYNVCCHRGNTVITETPGFREFTGRAKGGAMACRFHGWVYDSQGKLIHVPEEEHILCFQKEDHGLTPIACEEWNGFVFINLDPEPETSLEEFLGDYGDHFSNYPYEGTPVCFQYYTYLDANWKPCLDAFAEAYHVHTIHAGSFPNVFTSLVENAKIFGPHRTCSVMLADPGELTPSGAVANRIGVFNTLNKRGQTRLPPTLNPDRRENWCFELSVMFPSFLLHVLEGSWFTHHFWPIAVDKTLWEGHLYLPAATTHSERWALEQWQLLQRNAWLEDTATMEDTSRALMSGGKKEIYLHDEEVLIRHGYKVVDDWVHDRAGMGAGMAKETPRAEPVGAES